MGTKEKLFNWPWKWRKSGRTRDPEDVAVRPRKPPLLLSFRSDTRFITFVISMAVFTDIFLYGLVVPVFPFSLENRVGVSADSVQRWVTALLATYGAGLLVASPICGFLADHTTTRRLPLLVGLLALSGATIMLCIGNSITILVVGRLLQGISAAIVWSVGLALLADSVDASELGFALGYVSIGMSLAILLAPLLGGIVYDRGGYYAVFAMAFGLLAVDIALRLVLIEKKVARQYLPAETPSCLDNEVEAADTESQHTSRSAQQPAFPESGTPEASSSSPEPPLTKRLRLPPVITLLAQPRVLTALLASAMQALITTSFETTLPLFAAETYSFSSTGAGLLFLPMILPTFLSPLIGKLNDTYGPRWISAAGFIIACPFLILLRIVDRGGNESGERTRDIVVLCVLLVFVGIGLTLVIVPVMTEFSLVLESMEKERPGRFGEKGAVAQSYGLFNLAFSAGTLIGPILSGFLKSAAGWGAVMLTLGILSVATAVPTVIYTGGFITRADFSFRRKKSYDNTDPEERPQMAEA